MYKKNTLHSQKQFEEVAVNKIVHLNQGRKAHRSFTDTFDHLHSTGQRPRIAMVSTHGYVSANPPLGAADTGGQVVYVLELSKDLAKQGYEVDIWTRKFESQQEIETVAEHVRIIRMPSGGKEFIPKEYLHESLEAWVQNAWRFIQAHNLNYEFVNSHYWDAGIAGEGMASMMGVPHLHTPHSVGVWKMRQMETDLPDDREKFEKLYRLFGKSGGFSCSKEEGRAKNLKCKAPVFTVRYLGYHRRGKS